jgi:hypothetical protein
MERECAGGTEEEQLLRLELMDKMMGAKKNFTS